MDCKQATPRLSTVEPMRTDPLRSAPDEVFAVPGSRRAVSCIWLLIARHSEVISTSTALFSFLCWVLKDWLLYLWLKFRLSGATDGRQSACGQHRHCGHRFDARGIHPCQRRALARARQPRPFVHSSGTKVEIT